MIYMTVKMNPFNFWGVSKGCEINHNKQTLVCAIVLCKWKEVAKQHSLLKALERGFVPWLWVESGQLAVGFSQRRSTFLQLFHYWSLIVVFEFSAAH